MSILPLVKVKPLEIVNSLVVLTAACEASHWVSFLPQLHMPRAK